MNEGPVRSRAAGALSQKIAMVGRAFTLRCPHCGSATAVTGWFRSHPRCPGCHLRFDRGESDYWLGSLLFNVIAAELFFVGALVSVLLLTWPEPPWNALLYGGAVVMVVLPVITLPFSKDVWLAFDLMFRPLRSHDFADDARDGQDGSRFDWDQLDSQDPD
jgi:uncharacterized protein (DUF983 family)